MEIRHLKTFITVAKHSNFTVAGRELFLEQSAVSQQIAALEKDLEVKLFDRTKREVKLTNAGRVFLKDAKEIIRKSEDALVNIQDAVAGNIGRLRIGFLIAPIRNFLPRVINRFNKKYPQVSLELFHMPSSTLNNIYKSGELDIIFTLSMGLINVEDIECKILFKHTPCIYAHESHFCASSEEVEISKMREEKFIFRNRDEAPQWYDHSLEICANNGFTPRIIAQPKRIETVLLFVDAGMGVSIFPDYLHMYASDTIKVIPFKTEKNSLDIIMYHNKANENPSIKLFYDEVEDLLNYF